MTRFFLPAAFFAALLASPAAADVKLPSVFGSHMVVQRDKPLTVWGWADAGEEVTVTFGGKSATAKADDKGNWKVTLPAFEANAKPQTMTVKGKNTVELTDVLVGDVWVGSGQSNMEWSLAASYQAEGNHRRRQAPEHPAVPRQEGPGEDAGQGRATRRRLGRLHAARPCANFSAVLYHFGVRIQKDLDVPVGLINSSWGGSPIEPWTVATRLRRHVQRHDRPARSRSPSAASSGIRASRT